MSPSNQGFTKRKQDLFLGGRFQRRIFRSFHDVVCLQDVIKILPDHVFLIVRKTRRWLCEWSGCSSRAFFRRESTHVDARGPHW